MFILLYDTFVELLLLLLLAAPSSHKELTICRESRPVRTHGPFVVIMRSSAVSQVHSVTWAWEPGRVLYRATGELSISTACQLALTPFYRAESSDGDLRPTPSAPYLPVCL